MSKQPPTCLNLPPKLPNETERQYNARVLAEFMWNARSKDDLEGWTGSPPFHLAPERKP